MTFDSPYTMTIGGTAMTGTEFFDVLNPATERSIASAPDATREELDAAVTAARDAFRNGRRCRSTSARF